MGAQSVSMSSRITSFVDYEQQSFVIALQLHKCPYNMLDHYKQELQLSADKL
jgi:hypothetical protein